MKDVPFVAKGSALQLVKQVAPGMAIRHRVPDGLERNAAAVYLARLSKTGRETMRIGLTKIAGMLRPGLDAFTFPWHELRYEHCQVIRTRLAESSAPATANNRISALKGVLKECWRLKLMDGEVYQRAIDIPPVKGTRELAGRQLSAGELAKLFAVCDGTEDRNIGTRDAALLAILYGCGLRRAEIVGLDLASLSEGLMKVRGKGNKERIVPISKWVDGRIQAWLALRGTDPGPLFFPFGRGDKHQIRRMQPQSIYTGLKRLADQAGLKDHLSPHDLRRTLTSNLFDTSKDAHAIQMILGHANVSTTMRYDRRGERTKVAAVDTIKDPSK